MIWGVLLVIGGGSFVVNGFNVLTDPACDTVGFSGKVITTCYQTGGSESGIVSGTVGGIGMIIFGLILGVFALKSFGR